LCCFYFDLKESETNFWEFTHYIFAEQTKKQIIISIFGLKTDYMSEHDLEEILLQLLSLSSENEVVEFKEAKESYDFNKIGKYFSALSNEANLKGKSHAWLVFGVEDKKHQIVGSNYRNDRKKLDNLKKEIADKTTNNLSFIEIYELYKPEGRVVLFQIPSAPKGIPIAFDGHFYGRSNESLVALNIEKIERIRNATTNTDWSQNIVASATIDDLDTNAIQKAREQYRIKHPSKISDIDSWDDITFLNKAKITIEGKMTNTALLLLGKEESGHFLSSAIAQISWILKDAPGGYEHFGCPFILNVDKVLSCIRNLKYRHMGATSLFPEEVTHYDTWVIREALHNCVAHQDYSKRERITVLEYNNKLIFENAGNFIPSSIEEIIKQDRPQRYYRNLFLAQAMVNLNMIDTIGSGIKKMFTVQKDRHFPLPSFDISALNATIVTIYGEIINDNYAYQLKIHPELDLNDVILLDKVQKKIEINEEGINRLRTLKLVKGRSSQLQIEGYIKPKEISYNEYKKMILNLIREKGSTSREEIEALIMPTLLPDLPMVKKQKKISNIINRLSSKEGQIKNTSQSVRLPIWQLADDTKINEISNKKVINSNKTKQTNTQSTKTQ